MKYDMLRDYRGYLEGRYSRATADTYYDRMCVLLDGQYLIETGKDIDIEKVIKKLSEIKHKNYFSQCKNAFLHFCEFEEIKLNAETKNKIKMLEHSRRKKYRKLKTIDFHQTIAKIEHLKNEKLKLSYMVMLATGLRVSELAQITGANCIISDEKITMCFIGKGGKRQEVLICKSDDIDFYTKLVKHVTGLQNDEHAFYSSVYLQINAKKMGFTTLDLRRIYSQLEYKKSKSKKYVMKKMRHKSIKNTNIYLRSKIKYK